MGRGMSSPVWEGVPTARLWGQYIFVPGTLSASGGGGIQWTGSKIGGRGWAVTALGAGRKQCICSHISQRIWNVGDPIGWCTLYIGDG